MTFEEMLDQALALLQQRGRVTYGMLTRQFQLDEEALADLKEALLYTYPEVRDEAGRGLVWTGKAVATLQDPSPTASPQEREPLTYTPDHLAEKILTSKAALEGERKQVTVLFADLKGSMELLADRDPEDARAMLDPVLERMMAAVHRYEGTVNQVMGDGIMALFGAPIAHEDHAVRACYAALAMQEAIGRYAEALRRQQGLDVQIRIGINAGEVVVRSIGNDLHMDYTAVGQTTHLAARLEQLARPGTTLLTADTLRLVDSYVEVTPLGPVPVKGLPEPIEVYELLRAGPVRTRLQASAARGLTHFVGRDTELDTLRRMLEQAGAGQGQVVAVIGEPGVGKSRLVWEFIHAHRTQGWLILESRSVSYGKATPYLPVVDFLKAYCDVETPDDIHRVREKVTGKLLTLDRTLEPTLPALRALLDVPLEDVAWQALDPPQRRRQTLEAVRRLLIRESQEQPLLVVFEDLHWIDTETQALLDGLVESLPTARLLLLVNYRPEYQPGWGSKTYYTQVRLDPLPPANAEELLQVLLGDDPRLAPLTPLLITRTQGNPFFLEESVRTLVETQVLVGAPSAYRLAQVLPSIQVPATVQAVLAARIDRLPPEEKRLLQTAAVIGTQVPFPLLQAIADLPEDALHRALAHLQGAEFLYEIQLFPEREYTFKHALTHEVAYGSLLLERRRVLHAGIVEALESEAGDRLTEQVERLAHHALRGELWGKALMYGRQAAEKAMARSAHHEAVTNFEQVLSALSHLPECRETSEQAIDLRINLRHALFALGHHTPLLAHLRKAEALAEALNDQRRLGRVVAFMTESFRTRGEAERALACGQRAFSIAEALGDFALQVETHHHLGRVYHTRGDYHQAIDCFRWNVESLGEALLQERFGRFCQISLHLGVPRLSMYTPPSERRMRMTCPPGGSTATTGRSDGTALGYHRFRCHDCRRVLNERTGTPCNRLPYPTEVVCLVVFGRWRYQWSLRDLAEMFLQRGSFVTHETGRAWECKLAPLLSDTLRKRRPGVVGKRWYGEETYGRVQGQWQYLYRAMDRDGHLVDVRRSDTRDLAAAEAFFRSAWQVTGVTPDRITTDGHNASPRAIRTVFGDQVTHRTNRSLNNHLEQDHRGVTQRYRVTGGLKTFGPAARFCRLFDEIRALFRPPSYRTQRLTLAQRRCMHQARCAHLMGILAAA